MTPMVSIVLPTFNRLQFLRESVESVFAQTLKDWELIIADDGSDAETLAYLAALEVTPGVRLLRLAHSGSPSKVRNTALRESRGQYVAFLDSDDVWMPDKLRLQVAAHQACPERRWSYTALERIDAAGEPMRDGLGTGWVSHQGAIFEQLLTIEAAVATPSVMVDRRLLEQAGGFDEQQAYFEDYELWLRLSLLSEVILIDAPLIKVRIHGQHYSADRVSVYQARFRLLAKLAGHAQTPRLSALLRLERAKNSASLALVSAIAGRRLFALRMLWRSRLYAWHSGIWWHKAGSTLVRVLAPSWLQDVARKHRRNRRAQAAVQ
jgi:glycosyltransferase involved in cell wall biosynthesis